MLKRVTAEHFRTVTRAEESADPKVESAAAEIVADVRRNGDRALLAYTRKFDRVEAPDFRLEVSAEEIDAGAEEAGKKYADVLRFFLNAAGNIRGFHERQLDRGFHFEKDGCSYGQLVRPIPKAGFYVPGGKAFYPSTFLMNVIPAKIAGVPEMAVTSPPDRQGRLNPLLLALAKELGVTRLFKCGGAQAVAALAYGTETVPAVSKITGPGNAYVAAAKRLVMGTVGIDSIAGPSEVVIIADKSANPEWIAADLFAQAEHDGNNTAVLIATSSGVFDAVESAIAKLLSSQPRREMIEQSLEKRSYAVVTENLDEAFAVSDRIAPEHLQVMLDLPDSEALSRVHNAGAIFLGTQTPVAVGDYYAGPNHVLPTAGTAVFSSPLGVYDFVKRTSFVRLTPEYMREKGGEIASMADFEGLHSHALSARMRAAGKD
jgi:histidinol dehydrogenase